MNEITHEMCSERLEAYSSGRLDASARQEVDRHLASCPDCSLELAAVHALGRTEVLAMSGAERDRLTSAVRAAVFDAPKATLRERFGRRFAPALGAVALLAVAAIALVSLPDRTDVPAITSGESTQGGGDTAETLGRESADDAEAPEEQPKNAAPANKGTTSGGGQAAGGAPAPQSDAAASTGGTSLAARANFTVQEDAFAETGLDVGALVPVISPNARNTNAYDAGSAGLVASAPDLRLGRIARECAELTIATSPHPLVATSAAYYPDDVLVLGFVWLEESAKLLNYELRGWLGGNCDRISPIYRRGVVE